MCGGGVVIGFVVMRGGGKDVETIECTRCIPSSRTAYLSAFRFCFACGTLRLNDRSRVQFLLLVEYMRVSGCLLHGGCTGYGGVPR